MTLIDKSYQSYFRPFIFQSGGSTLVGCNNADYGTDLNSAYKGVYTLIALVSMVSAIFIALTIFWNPKLRSHPSLLIAFMCICESISCFNSLIYAIGTTEFICYFALHYIFRGTVFNT